MTTQTDGNLPLLAGMDDASGTPSFIQSRTGNPWDNPAGPFDGEPIDSASDTNLLKRRATFGGRRNRWRTSLLQRTTASSLDQACSNRGLGAGSSGVSIELPLQRSSLTQTRSGIHRKTFQGAPVAQ